MIALLSRFAMSSSHTLTCQRNSSIVAVVDTIRLDIEQQVVQDLIADRKTKFLTITVRFHLVQDSIQIRTMNALGTCAYVYVFLMCVCVRVLVLGTDTWMIVLPTATSSTLMCSGGGYRHMDDCSFDKRCCKHSPLCCMVSGTPSHK